MTNKPHMTGAVKKTLPIAFLALIAGSIYLMTKNYAPEYSGELQKNRTTDMTAYAYTIGDKKYCIPKSYFSWKNSFQSASGVGINLSMEIESFSPWNTYKEKALSGENKKNLSMTDLRKINKHEIRLIVRDINPHEKQRIWELLLSKSKKSIHNGAYHRYEKSPLLTGDYYLVPIDKPNFSWVLGCVSGARCMLQNQLDNKLIYELSFDEAYLDKLDDLDVEVRSFLQAYSC